MTQRTLLLLLASAFLLAACGQKGPLYFPEEAHNTPSTPTLYDGTTHDAV